MRPYHEKIAAVLHAGLHGEVLAIGGTWVGCDPDAFRGRLTVTDVSISMLIGFREQTPRLVQSDASQLPFGENRFDHIVYPLVLHHLAGHSISTAREILRSTLIRGIATLKPGGRVWISDFAISRPVFLAQRLAAPMTRALLSSLGQPFVVMHARSHYLRLLRELGCREISASEPRPPDVHALDWVPPIIAAPRFRVPRFMLPLRPTLISAVRSPAIQTF